jgi:two-component system sensor histidine kinase KdpD
VRVLTPYLQSVGFVLAATVAAELLFRLTATTRLSMVFLAGVLVAAYLLGSGPAYFAAVLAFIVYNFYLVEPRFALTLTTLEDLITLTVFLVVAMLTGNLTGRIRDEAARAVAREHATARLFDATRDFSIQSDEQRIRQLLSDHLAAAVRGQAVVRDGAQTFTSPPGLELGDDLQKGLIAVEGDPRQDIVTQSRGGWLLRPLQMSGARFGVACWKPGDGTSLAQGIALLEIMSDVGAAAIARARLATDKSDAETRVRTEELRNALLSSVSHDLRTPLAAILASATSLKEFSEQFDRATRAELAATIQEEAERLDAFVANLLNMSRLEAGALSLQQMPFDLAEVVHRTVNRQKAAFQRPVDVKVGSSLPDALGDPVLFEQALANVLANAFRYTSSTCTVEVSVTATGDDVVAVVTDSGPGVGAVDVDRLFDKFFRSQTSADTSGTGLGLAITKGLMEAMGGSAAARNRAERSGLAVTLKLKANKA